MDQQEFLVRKYCRVKILQYHHLCTNSFRFDPLLPSFTDFVRYMICSPIPQQESYENIPAITPEAPALAALVLAPATPAPAPLEPEAPATPAPSPEAPALAAPALAAPATPASAP